MERERRVESRAPFGSWVEITAEGRRRRGTATDLSPGGIGVRLSRDLPDCESVVVAEFALPGISLPLALEGRVAWHDGSDGRIGVSFERVDPGLVELLESYVAGSLPVS